jgi:hypothetical protein
VLHFSGCWVVHVTVELLFWAGSSANAWPGMVLTARAGDCLCWVVVCFAKQHVTFAVHDPADTMCTINWVRGKYPLTKCCGVDGWCCEASHTFSLAITTRRTLQHMHRKSGHHQPGGAGHKTIGSCASCCTTQAHEPTSAAHKKAQQTAQHNT